MPIPESIRNKIDTWIADPRKAVGGWVKHKTTGRIYRIDSVPWCMGGRTAVVAASPMEGGLWTALEIHELSVEALVPSDWDAIYAKHPTTTAPRMDGVALDTKPLFP